MSDPTAPSPEPDDPSATEPGTAPPAPSGARASSLVAAGILLSRIAGLVRDVATAGYLGTSLYADAFRAGLRMPNVLQNLLGEGTLSASFIPVYAELLHDGRKEEAGRVAGSIFALLAAVAGALSLLGVFLAPLLVSVFLSGFDGEQRELTIRITRIIFPMTGVLVLSAWSLGVLNSHRHFFVPYVAPVAWNAAIIAALVLFSSSGPADLVVAGAWGALIGGALQFLVQLPAVLRLERSLRIRWDMKLEGVRSAVRNAGPAIMGRGVVQLSSYADLWLASGLVAGSVAVYTYALTLYVLPVSLFGMSVAAAELPELARQRTAAHDVLRARAGAGLERVLFYVIPSAVAFVAIGDVLVGALYERGEFSRGSTTLVWITLVGLALGLIATTASRLLSSTFFALRDTRTPARFATIRVVTSIMLSVAFMLLLEGIRMERLGIAIPGGPLSWVRMAGKPVGVLGLALGSGCAAWVEWALLKRALRRRIGSVGARPAMVARMLVAAAAAAAAGWGVRLLFGGLSPLPMGVLVVAAFGAAYFGVAAVLGLEQSDAIVRRVRLLLRR